MEITFFLIYIPQLITDWAWHKLQLKKTKYDLENAISRNVMISFLSSSNEHPHYHQKGQKELELLQQHNNCEKLYCSLWRSSSFCNNTIDPGRSQFFLCGTLLWPAIITHTQIVFSPNHFGQFWLNSPNKRSKIAQST